MSSTATCALLTFAASRAGLGWPTAFAYGKRIHDQCSRRAHFDAGQSSRSSTIRGPRRMVPVSRRVKGRRFFRQSDLMWTRGRAGDRRRASVHRVHRRSFWDTMTPFYTRLPNVAGIGVERTADGHRRGTRCGSAAGVIAHAAATGVQQMRARSASRELPVMNAVSRRHTSRTPPISKDEGAGNGAN